jgi:predicted metal-binding membrane protein
MWNWLAMNKIFTSSSAQSRLTVIVVLVSFLAAMGLWGWGLSPFADFLRHDAATERGLPDVLFVLGWLLMCIAMMLPIALPLLAAVERLTERRPDAIRLIVITALGFLGVWLGAGILVRGGDILLHTLVEQVSWFAAHSHLIGAALLSLGGGYLLLPIAQQCVKACRSPMGFIAREWTGQPNLMTQAARIGIGYGVSCCGCCWPLMAVMCALGMSNPVWMLSFTLVMMLQKHSRYGRSVTIASGVLMVAGSFVLLTGMLPTVDAGHGHMHGH